MCELDADLVLKFFGIDGGLGVDAKRAQFGENAVVAVILRRRASAGLTIPAPDDRHFVRA